jgi:hypothetical protein
MSDAWYYAEDGAAKGPMPFGDLVHVLSVVRDPADVLVWRAGFQSWTRAADVAELATRLVAFPAGSGFATGTQPPAGEPEPLRIGGWLILLAIGQALAPIQVILGAASILLPQYLHWKIVGGFPTGLIGFALLFAAFLILVTQSAWLFFRKSRRFPRFFVFQALLTLFYLTGAPLGIAMAGRGLSFDEALARTFTASDIAWIVVAVVIFTVWIAYLYISKRARMTFIR